VVFPGEGENNPSKENVGNDTGAFFKNGREEKGGEEGEITGEGGGDSARSEIYLIHSAGEDLGGGEKGTAMHVKFKGDIRYGTRCPNRSKQNKGIIMNRFVVTPKVVHIIKKRSNRPLPKRAGRTQNGPASYQLSGKYAQKTTSL